MAIQLRSYQQTAVSEIRTALARYRRVLFQAQTGFGKTIVYRQEHYKKYEKHKREPKLFE